MTGGLVAGLVHSVATAMSRPLNDSPVPLSSSRGGALVAGFAAGSGSREASLGAMTSAGVVFAIVDALANGTSQVEWHLWRPGATGRDEDRTEVLSHAFLDLMGEPNPFMPRQELVEVGQQHIELTGECFMCMPLRGGMPMEIWPVLPHRVHPVKHPTKFLVGYMYHGPDGEKVPLALDEVEMIRLPNPMDPYRGIGPLQSVLVDVDSARYSAEWNRNFFLNSAEPGGIIEVPAGMVLSDSDFLTMRRRWQEQHRGVAQAHRVAILEHGKWVDRKFTMRDMQFAELRGVSTEVIRMAWRFPKPILGTVDDVNRAVAEAMNSIFSQWLLVPRLERWKAAFNNILHRYPTGRGLVYDYESPVPADREADRQDLQAKAAAAKALVEAGYDPQEVCATVGLPIMSAVARRSGADETVGAALEAAMRGEFDRLRAMLDTGRREIVVVPAAVAGPGQLGPAPRIESLSDVSGLQADWETRLEALLAQWRDDILPAQYADAEAAVRAAVESADIAGLAGITVGSLAAAEALTAAMLEIAETAAAGMAAEAAEQGVPDPVTGQPPALELAATAGATAALLAAGVAMSAAGEALRLFSADAAVDEVVSGVSAHLNALTDAQPRLRLGSALTSAQNAGRMASLKVLPPASYYANEQNDQSTCGPCEDIHGTEFESLAAVLKQYPNGQFRGCEGRSRCRGTYEAKWSVD